MRLESLRTIFGLAAIPQLDITSDYLHGTLKEGVYMEQPEGYVAPGKKDWVWRMKKGLYGSVQAGRTWNEELNARTKREGFTATARNQRFTSKTSGRAQSRRSRILGGRLRRDREWEGARYPP